MNQQQVSAIENIPMKQMSSSEWAVLISESPVQVSRFYADLVYIFRQDALRMITYEFTKDCSTLNYQYLTGALESLYGTRTEAEPLKIKALMDTINPDRYRTDLISQACGWTHDDGTTVYLYYYSEKDFAITYVSPEMGSRIYQTNGL